ncbi:MAG: universal stress protein [Desulfarculus sp.]|nr:universal stress protein [Desulfarculus sp.]
MDYKLIAVATDFSPGALAAFDTALDLARQTGARLLVAHVIPPLITPSPLLDDLTVSQMTMQLRQDLSDSAQREIQTRYLDQAQGLRAEAVVLEGDPSRELINLVGQRGVDLLVVGATGLSGLAEVFFGSVAAKAVRRCPCSVMVVRSRPTQAQV